MQAVPEAVELPKIISCCCLGTTGECSMLGISADLILVSGASPSSFASVFLKESRILFKINPSFPKT